MIALATVDEGAFLTRHWDGGSCSYADDITSISATFNALQGKADIVGMDLADAKFRAFMTIFGTGIQHVQRYTNMVGLSLW
jgi:hypothetical protein